MFGCLVLYFFLSSKLKREVCLRILGVYFVVGNEHSEYYPSTYANRKKKKRKETRYVRDTCCVVSMLFVSVSVLALKVTTKRKLPSYLCIYSLYIFLYVTLLLTLLVSVAGSCFLQWTQKILTINKKLSRYSLSVSWYSI